MPARMAVGRSKQELIINRVQTFSHSHRPKNRIGRVKLPFITPDRIANDEPISTASCILTSLLQRRLEIASSDAGLIFSLSRNAEKYYSLYKQTMRQEN